jgi:hypothetical protein
MNTIQECSLITTNELASHLEGSQRLQLLIAKLSEIRRALITHEFRGRITAAHPAYRRSVANLIHYLALRRRDIRLLQEELAALGLSSLGRAESHTLWTLDAVLNILRHLSGRHQQSRSHLNLSVSLKADQCSLRIPKRCWAARRRIENGTSDNGSKSQLSNRNRDGSHRGGI